MQNISKGRSALRVLLALSFMIPVASPAMADGLAWKQDEVEVTKVTFYPKKWKGKAVTWVDVAVKNTSGKPRNYRAVVMLGNEPAFAVRTKTEVQPGEEATITVSTTAATLEQNADVAVQVVE